MAKIDKWVKAKCPECGCEYEYPEDFKLPTCAKSECVRKHLHPELSKRKEVN